MFRELKPEDVDSKIKEISAHNPVYAELVAFVGGLLMETIRMDAGSPVPMPEILPNQVEDRLRRGKPQLKPAEMPVDWPAAKDRFDRLARLVEKHTDDPEAAAAWGRASIGDESDEYRLLKAFLASDAHTLEVAAEESRVDPSALALLIGMALRPALVRSAGIVADALDLSLWKRGVCPVCGSTPALADIAGDEGKRTLYCSLCETPWPYPRIKCPNCENDDPDSLWYIKAENETGLRVDMCGRCGNWLKTIDRRELPSPIIVPLDDAATWHLELLAEKHKEPETPKTH